MKKEIQKIIDDMYSLKHSIAQIESTKKDEVLNDIVCCLDDDFNHLVKVLDQDKCIKDFFDESDYEVFYYQASFLEVE